MCGAVFVLHAGVTRVRFLNGWVSASTFEGLGILEEYAALLSRCACNCLGTATQ
eukprot:COSAG01_NODE_8738_length_2677_cov_3.877424_2_plen_54_part_00